MSGVEGIVKRKRKKGQKDMNYKFEGELVSKTGVPDPALWYEFYEELKKLFTKYNIVLKVKRKPTGT